MPFGHVKAGLHLVYGTLDGRAANTLWEGVPAGARFLLGPENRFLNTRPCQKQFSKKSKLIGKNEKTVFFLKHEIAENKMKKEVFP